MELKKFLDNEIFRYSHIILGGKEVSCPYFINRKNTRDLRAMVGKGTPSEIKMESEIWAKIKGINFDQLDSESIKNFLTEKGIGIDCSGFVSHIINAIYKKITGKTIWRELIPKDNSFIGRIKYFLRPVEQLGAHVLTSANNTDTVAINQARVLDLIRSSSKKLNGDHIMLVTDIKRDKNGAVLEIEYTHSTPYYGKLSGVKKGVVRIKHPDLPLEKQEWLEIDEFGVNHTLEGYLTNPLDNGLRRLKVFKDLEIV